MIHFFRANWDKVALLTKKSSKNVTGKIEAKLRKNEEKKPKLSQN